METGDPKNGGRGRGGDGIPKKLGVFFAPFLIIIEIISQKSVFFGKNAIREGAKNTQRGWQCK